LARRIWDLRESLFRGTIYLMKARKSKLDLGELKLIDKLEADHTLGYAVFLHLKPFTGVRDDQEGKTSLLHEALQNREQALSTENKITVDERISLMWQAIKVFEEIGELGLAAKTCTIMAEKLIAGNTPNYRGHLIEVLKKAEQLYDLADNPIGGRKVDSLRSRVDWDTRVTYMDQERDYSAWV